LAQAQHKIWELTQLPRNSSVKVKFAIHPVAGFFISGIYVQNLQIQQHVSISILGTTNHGFTMSRQQILKLQI